MTAEVSVMNRLAVALAADSAVTLGQGPKIYTSADKLFQLSRFAPVGIMFYGSADVLGVPVETVVKVFRRQLGKQVFDKLEDYREAFLKFIRDDTVMFGPASQSRFVLSVLESYFSYVLKSILARLGETFASGPQSEAEIRKVIAHAIQIEREERDAVPFLDGFGPADAKQIYGSFTVELDKALGDTFKKLPLSVSQRSSLKRLGSESFIKTVFGSSQTGMVIAGFGESDVFPVMTQTALRGKVGKKLLVDSPKPQRIADSSPALVVPFAHSDMVETFMEGIDGSLRELLWSTTSNVFDGLATLLVERLASSPQEATKFAKNLAPHIRDLKRSLRLTWQDASAENYTWPIMGIVQSLPKEELAAMAETLVSITKFKRRVSADLETVSGPIDVALISKGDGFVWVKRKHYFDLSLNPRYFAATLKEALE